MVRIELRRWYVPIRRWQVVTWPLQRDMQTLPDVLEDLCSPANLRYQARSLLAQNGQKRNWHPLFVLASSEPVMVVIGQAQGSRFELRGLRQVRIQPLHFADLQRFLATRRLMIRFPVLNETPTVGKCNVSLICRHFRSPTRDGTD